MAHSPSQIAIGARTALDRVCCADSSNMGFIEDGVVDLVICSPPYNVGKNYKNHNDALPLHDYLALLRAVWTECRRSGSTCVAAVQLGRHWIGVDIDPSYYKLARERVAAEGKLQEAAPPEL